MVNTAIGQPSGGAALLTRSLDKYLVTSLQNAMLAINTDMHSHSLMTATVVLN